MSEERDPLLETLFVEAQQAFEGERFTADVMARTEARRRRVLLGRVAIGALIVMLELLLDSPLQHSVGALTEMLGTSLLVIENEWLDFVVSPINSVAGLLGLILLSVHFIYRKMVH